MPSPLVPLATIVVLLLLLQPSFILLVSRELIERRREVVTVSHGVVAADDGRCSRIGRDVLQEGGHAVDASVAAALCLGVVSPASSGIGGGAFMLVRNANGKAQAFDMRETAPLLASQNMYAANVSLKSSGALSVAVPSELAGLHEAWKQHGRLPWKRLVIPAQRLAQRGFKISPFLYMQMVKTKTGIFSDEGLRSIFTSEGNLLQPGDLCRNEKLAQTLKIISRYGPDAFYNGSIGINLVRDVQKSGGMLTMKDLLNYKVKVKEPISAEIMGVEILGMPPPSSGGAGMILVIDFPLFCFICYKELVTDMFPNLDCERVTDIERVTLFSSSV